MGIFLLSAIFGWAFSSQLGFIDKFLKELIDNTEGLNTFQLIAFIFFNNLRSALYGMLLGIFFGIYPLINSIINGSVIGYVFNKVYGITGISEFWRILPHGIFELPAIFISLGLGTRIGMFWFSKNMKKDFVFIARNALKAFFLIVVPLLVIAAIIEGILIGILE